MSALPPVGLLAEPGSPPGFVALVRCLSAWCRPQATGPEPVAWLASSPAVAGDRHPVAIWAGGVVMTPDGPVRFPDPGIDLRSCPPMAPVVRSRWRSRFGLPETMVVDATDLPDDLLPTALTLASVVIVTGPRLAEALAWAAPCVTDAVSAAAVGAGEGDVAVDALPEDVARDEGWASALSAAGRRLAERRLDQHAAAHQVAAALRLLPSVGPAERVLDDLHTPWSSPLRRRVAALVDR